MLIFRASSSAATPSSGPMKPSGYIAEVSACSLSRFEASLLRACRGGCIHLGGIYQSTQREMSMAHKLKDANLNFGSNSESKLQHQFVRMVQYLDAITIGESPHRIVRRNEQIIDGLLVVAASFEMQGKFRRQFLLAGIAERLESLCQ